MPPLPPMRRAAPAVARWLVALAEIDTRSLAAFRMALGLVVLVDVVSRARSAREFLTDSGVLPRATAERLASPLSPSLHFASGDVHFQYVLLAIAAAAAVAVVVGFRTRVALIVCLVLTISIANRNPALHHTADQYVRVMLAWSIVSPLAAAHSWDAARRRLSAPTRVATLGTAGLLGQVLVVYGLSSWHKWGNLSYWWHDGSMLSYVLELDVYATRWGSALKGYPEALRLLTRASFVLETFAPPVAFLAIRWPRVRTAIVVAMIGFHVGTAALMAVGNFPLISTAAWLAFLPGWFWDRIGVRHASWAASGPSTPRPLSPLRGALVALPALALWVALGTSLAVQVLAVSPKVAILDRPAFAAGFTHDWAMFSAPGTDDGWLVAAGTFVDGSRRDLLTDREVSWVRPRVIGDRFPDDRWRTYLFRVTGTTYGDHRRFFAEYLCRRHGRGVNPVVDIELTYMRVQTRVVGGRVAGELPVEPMPRIQGECRKGGREFFVPPKKGRDGDQPRPTAVRGAARIGL